MYCDRCGISLHSTSQFCSSCGKRIIPTTVQQSRAPLSAGDDRVRRHIHRLATLWLVQGVLRLLFVLWLLVAGGMIPSVFGAGRPFVWPFLRGWGLDLLPGVSLVLGIFCLAHFVLAWGLYERQPWARYLGLVLGFLALVRFPFGTALGIYTIWVLLPESSGREYERLAHAT
jgi:hypothetical protein